MGKKGRENKQKGDKLIPAAIVGSLILAVIVALLFMAAINVPAGHKAVVISGFGTIGEQHDEGFQFINPFVEIDIVRWNTQGMEETISVLTNDEYNVPIDFQVTFHLMESRVGHIRTENPDYKETVIMNLLRSEVRKTAADLNLTGEQLNKKRTLFEATVEARCVERMGEYFVAVESVNVRNINLPAQILNASERRAAAKIDIETASYELSAERARAQKEQVKAEAEANATVILAEGQAKSIEILAALWIDEYGADADLSYEQMMDFILSMRYIAALRDPECNVQFVIVPEDGPALLLSVEEMQEQAGET